MSADKYNFKIQIVFRYHQHIFFKMKFNIIQKCGKRLAKYQITCV